MWLQWRAPLVQYEGLASEYAHQAINHAVAYVDGKVYTNGLENIWVCLSVGSREPT